MVRPQCGSIFVIVLAEAFLAADGITTVLPEFLTPLFTTDLIPVALARRTRVDSNPAWSDIDALR
ncbi:hypothetical protein WYO_0839 [Methylobacterium sp. GXF4]|nr:hypothetical protein WYO_0839 [Methylobacterium sp. GXF4]